MEAFAAIDEKYRQIANQVFLGEKNGRGERKEERKIEKKKKKKKEKKRIPTNPTYFNTKY